MQNNSNYIVVIGASNIDIGGTPYAPLIKADSNPGRISISYGGVGRNIAHDLCLLGADVRLVTAFGSDNIGIDMIRYCNDAGLDTSHSIISDDHISSMYMYINNEDGDMELALSDMDVCKLITPEYIDKIADIITGAVIVAADCNLPQDTILRIRDICVSADVPLFIDPVSVNKAYKIKDNLNGIFAIKPNIIEASYLTGIDISSREDCIAAASDIICQGVQNVFISMGSEGILAANKDDYYYADVIRSEDPDVVCTTGAGDASAAAIIWAYYINSNQRSGISDNNNNVSDQIIINDSDISEKSFSDDHILETAARAANAAASIIIRSHNTSSIALNERSIINFICE